MFYNVGEKIKKLAKIICWLGIIGNIILGILSFIVASTDIFGINFGSIISGFLFLIVGPLCSWASSLLVYGFGELVEKTAEIAANTRAEKILIDMLTQKPATKDFALNAAPNLIITPLCRTGLDYNPKAIAEYRRR